MSARFNWVVSGHYHGPDPVCDVDLLVNPLAAVVPTIGSIVAGWVLVVPRIGALSIRDLDQVTRAEILTFARKAGEQVTAFGGLPYIFEHGPSAPNSSIGCGVDQAHIHVVPLGEDLLGAALADQSVTWVRANYADPWQGCRPDCEYLLVCRGTECFIGFTNSTESQFFRRKIAQVRGTPDAWNYREWPFYDNARRTIEHFQARGDLLAA